MSKAACKVVIDGGTLREIGELGRAEPAVGKILDSRGARPHIEAIAAACAELGALVSADLLAVPSERSGPLGGDQ